MKQTALHDVHVSMNAKMVDFGGWHMPVQYEHGIITEHNTVRSSAGLFDVSHMGEILVTGKNAEIFVDHIITNNVAKLSNEQICYSPMCNDSDGIVDDLLAYKYNSEKILLVVNASNIEKDFNWIKQQSSSFTDVVIENMSDDYAQLALQGPKAINILQPLVNISLNEMDYYWFKPDVSICGTLAIVSRTGYTGEDGFEIYFKNSTEIAERIWNTILKAGKPYGILPIGLGARDTLRFEPKFMLYGNELDDNTNPMEAKLAWTVDLEKKDFIGKDACLKYKEEPRKHLIGFKMIDKGIPRHEYSIVDENENDIGYVTSGCKAPHLDEFLGLGYVNRKIKRNAEIFVKIRKKVCKAVVVKTPFYKKPPLSTL